MAKMGYDVFSAMQEGEPLARYKKTILGQVHVVVLNPFSEEPEGLILKGDPNKASELDSQIVEVWSDKADAFFKRMNRAHFEAGRLAVLESKPEEPKSPNELTDEEVDKILNSKFLTLKSKLNSFTSEAPVFRLLNRARELEKSEKLIKHIEKRLQDLQLESYGVTSKSEDE